MKTCESQRFSEAFRGYRSETFSEAVSFDTRCDLLREKGPTAVKRRFKTQLTAFSL